MEVIEIVAQKIKQQSVKNFLDIGCGKGNLCLYIKKSFPEIHVTGIDVNPKSIKVAKEHADKLSLPIDFLPIGAEQLDFPSNSFDVIISVKAFHHLSPEIREKTIKKIYQMLKPHGIFLLIDVGKPTSFVDNIIHVLGNIFEPREFKHYVSDVTEGNITNLLEQTGFAVKEFHHPVFGLHFLEALKT